MFRRNAGIYLQAQMAILQTPPSTPRSTHGEHAIYHIYHTTFLTPSEP